MSKTEFLYRTTFENQEELFHGVSIYLEKNGFVENGFAEQLYQREQAFPTGLPTVPAVAIPHTDGSLVKKDTIVCVLNERTIPFREMGGDEEAIVYPKVFFVLALSSGEAHLQELQRLIEKIQEGQLVESVLKSEGPVEFETILKKYL